MKRVWGSVSAVVVIVASFLGAGLIGVSPVAAAPNHFSISSFDIKYELSRDTDQHSQLRTTQTIVANFSDRDYNHGLEVALRKNVHDHTSNLKIVEVTDENGLGLQYSTRTDNKGIMVLRIGDPDKYVHGENTYRIVYTQQDVTSYYTNTDSDEWYWDTNGPDWKVPIHHLSVSVALGDGLDSALKQEPACYHGPRGSTDRCAFTKDETGTYHAELRNLKSGDNMTIGFGFTPGTFVNYQPTFFEQLFKIWQLGVFFGMIAGIAILIGLGIAYARKRNRQSELHTIPAEYIPPKNASVSIASQVITPIGNISSAQLIDLAVRHSIAIIETKPKAGLSPAEYDIRVLTAIDTLSEEEREIITDMFGRTPAVGEQLSLKSLQTDRLYRVRLLNNARMLKDLADGKYALREKSQTTSKFFYNWALALGIAGVVTVSPPLIILTVIVAIMGSQIRPLTDKGLELRRYLLGLKKYIGAAEAERLKLLQGPDTAEKVGEVVDVNNKAQIVKLYERVLPYAILFGQEKEWSKRLGEFYQTTQTAPDWYVGTSAFNAAIFATTLSNFSSATSIYSGGSGSSYGGSSGGGFSGGGAGGGAGGGGW